MLFFHGIPGSRLQRPADVSIIAKRGWRVYALDRPGIGLSDPDDNKTINSWADDVRFFCRAQHLQEVAILGVSGGGPYALGCGRRLDICSAVMILSSLAPLDEPALWQSLTRRSRILFQCARRLPSLTRIAVAVIFRLSRGQLQKIFDYLKIPLAEYDRRVLSQPAVVGLLKKDVAEAFRQGSRAIVAELQAQMRPWGFDLGKVTVPVQIWHGTADTIVPPVMASFLAKHIPGAELHWVKDGGHFIALECVGEVLQNPSP